MSNKVVYIKPDEEITSVIDKLVNVKDKEVFLVVPKGAVLGQSSVNLKLLKREANNLGKEIIIVSQDPALRRLAEKNNFSISDTLEQESVQSKAQEESEGSGEDVLQESIPEEKFEDLLREEKKSLPLKIIDIVSGAEPKGKLLIKKSKEPEEEAPQLFKTDGMGAVVESEQEIKIKNFQKPEINKPMFDEKISKDSRYDFLKPRGEKKPQNIEPGQKIQAQESDRPFLLSFPGKIFALFIASALIIAAFVSFLILPKAEILISVKREILPVDMKISVDKNLSQPNIEQGLIPGQLIKLEEKITQEFKTTGQRQLNEKAKGLITVYNAFSSSPQTLVETTRFLSPDGLIFRLVKTVTIPGAKIEQSQIVPSTLDVLVEADQSGSQYNIAPATFTIPGFAGSPKYEGFYGKSKNEMTGGSTENVRVLTQDDFNNAKAQAWESLKEKISAGLLAQIPPGFTFLDGVSSIELTQAQPSVEVGEKTEKFSVTLKGIAKAMIFSQENMLMLLKNKLISDPGQKDFSEKKSLIYENIKVDLGKGLLEFQVKGEQEVFWKINVDELKSLIAGKGEADVRTNFSGRPEISEAQFSLWPFWVKRIPTQRDKIEITID